MCWAITVLIILPVLDPSSKPVLMYKISLQDTYSSIWFLEFSELACLLFSGLSKLPVVLSGSRTWLLACFLDPLLQNLYWLNIEHDPFI